MAFVEAKMDHGVVGAGAKPRAQGLLVCNLDDWTMPAFYTDPDQVYDPVPCPTPSVPFDFSVQGLDVVSGGTDTEAVPDHDSYQPALRGTEHGEAYATEALALGDLGSGGVPA